MGKIDGLNPYVKGGTSSTRNHRFESFNQRISKINIDPIRKRQRHESPGNDLGVTASFFRSSLDRWRDLNLSESFTNFTREVDPLCNSLPQVLHYRTRIIQILLNYIGKSDTVSLEPLLDLLKSIAHDLGARFEDHFESAVSLVASLAAGHKDVEVIEWSFTCLAWLFKYLSRLLVPDLSSTFRIMAPLLGREPQKLYTTRFAAEAMSFLVRKAALAHSKDQRPLAHFLDAVNDDLAIFQRTETRADRLELYKVGLMTLLLESMKGINRKVHSCAVHLYQGVVEKALIGHSMQRTMIEDILLGVTVALIHQTDAEGFRPILDVILDNVGILKADMSEPHIDVCGRLVFIAVTVRRGSRIEDWESVLDAILKLLRQIEDTNASRTSAVLSTAAVAFQYAPFDVVIPRFRSVMSILESDTGFQHFLPFCSCFCDIGRERFNDFCLSHLSKFIVSRWHQNEYQLCLTLPKLLKSASQGAMACPADWQEAIIGRFNTASVQDSRFLEYWMYLELFEILPPTSETTNQITKALGKLFSPAIQTVTCDSMQRTFTFGTGLKAYTKCPSISKAHISNMWPDLCALSVHCGTMIPYLDGVSEAVKIVGHQGTGDDNCPLMFTLIGNLRSASQPLRRASLQLLQDLYIAKHSKSSDIVTTALLIETSALDLSSARILSSNIGKLAKLYGSASADTWLSKAIPSFCFGILSYKLQQAKIDASAALKLICESPRGEEVVWDICSAWLQNRAEGHREQERAIPEDHKRQSLTIFQCSNLENITAVIRQNTDEIASAAERQRNIFDLKHRLHDVHVANSPLLALQVLLEIPYIAEKRSRYLVPMFLSWAATEYAEVEESSTVWNHHERKAMLRLFGCFQNPAVLFKSAIVFESLRGLLANGDLEVQKLALQALFTWRNQDLQPYREQLFNLLDEARFRDEIATFLQIDDKDSIIETDHRQLLMPILLRLLYGRMVARSGTKSGKGGQESKRRAVLQALSRLDETDMHTFLEIILGSLNGIDVLDEETELPETHPSARKQLGMLNMLKDLLTIMGRKLAFIAQKLTAATSWCVIRATRHLHAYDLSVEGDDAHDQQLSLLKAIRQTGLQCIIMLSKVCRVEDIKPYMRVIFAEVLSPRLSRLAIETAQSVSTALRLYATLASSPETICFLVDYDTRVYSSLIDCLDVASAKDGVKLFVLEHILKKSVAVVKASTEDESRLDGGSAAIEKVLQPNIEYMLERLGTFLRRSPSKELLGCAIELISMTAPLVSGSSQSESLLDISSFLLRQPSQRVSPKTKGDLLQIIRHFMPFAGPAVAIYGANNIYETVTSLFGYFKDRRSRESLCEVMIVLAERDQELQEPAGLCKGLNAFSHVRLDEPEFDERLRAFYAINESGFKHFTSKVWRPLLYNMLYYVKDNDELSIRTNSSYALRRFVESNLIDPGKMTSESALMVKDVLLPAIRSGISSTSELVRTEYLGIMAHLVMLNPSWTEVNDMRPLLVEEDEEASFFGNILHIQQHRRLRALRRLASEARHGQFLSSNVAHFFMPLVEHFVTDRGDDESAHNLSAEAVKTIGTLASALEWPQYRAVFRRYSAYIKSKPDIEKTMIRLLGIVIDSLSQATKEKLLMKEVGDLQSSGKDAVIRDHLSTLAKTMPGQERLTEDLSNHLLPSLIKYLHEKDESTVSLRIPIAISIIKLLKLFPDDKLRERLPPVLTDVCHILRSRAQESRDLTRKTLTEIVTLIGPAYFGFVLKELRSALARGYQLHVLSFTMHSMLVATSTIFKPGDLNYCLPTVVAIIMDDIFGATGQEKDAEEYISKMKEVKSSKSQDSMELIAMTVTVDNLVHLIKPLQNLLEEKLDHRMVRKIDELLRRISVGFLRNDAAHDQRVLVLCHEIVTEVYKASNPASTRSSKEDYRIKRFLVNSQGARKAGDRGSTSSYNYKLARFALDILRAVLHKHGDLQTPANLAGFMPIIGDALIQSNEEIQISALRLLTAIIKVPLLTLDENAPVFVAECVKIVRASTSTTVELAQAALKLVSAILRERRATEIRETDVAYLLRRLIPDLEEPDKQGVAFNFLKAVMARKIVITEVYEVMDVVSAMMVTNQTKGARDMARGAYFHFVMEYPQSKDRFLKQMGFLVKNLDYQYEEGRQSIMEAIHLLFKNKKVGIDLAQQIIETFFVPLAMVVINDESAKCREMSGALLKMSLEHADAERKRMVLRLLRTWITRFDEPIFVRLSLQIYAIYLDTSKVDGKADQETSFLMIHLAQILKDQSEWETLFYALQSLAKISSNAPNLAFADTTADLWTSIREKLRFSHAWVKLSSARLLGVYFADFARTNANDEITRLPVQGSGGLLLTEAEIVDTTRSSLHLLKATNINEELAAQTVRNLVFVGKIMAQTGMTWPHSQSQPASSGEEKMDREEDSEADDDEAEEQVDESVEEERPPLWRKQSALAHLLRSSANILRQPPPTTRNQNLLTHHSTALLLGTIISTMPLPLLSDHNHRLLRTILLPLHNLTDPSIPAPFSISNEFTESYKSLQTKAHEMLGILQKRLGVTEYTTAMQKVRNDVRDRREERRGRKRVEVVAHPERSEAKRRKKGLQKKEGRKKRGEAMGRMRKGL